MNNKPTFLFPGAITPWVNALAQSLAGRGHQTSAVSIYDWRNRRGMRKAFAAKRANSLLKQKEWLFPPGYLGAAEFLFTPILRILWRSELSGLASTSASPTWIICAYPWLYPALASMGGDRLIYFNLDEYHLYRPERQEKILAQEHELILRANMILCLSKYQVDAFRARFPEKASRIRHFPLAAPELLINPDPRRGFVENTVGYVGNLIDRVDWDLVEQVVLALKTVRFIFVGYANVHSGGGKRAGWEAVRDRVLEYSNVTQIPTVPQNEVGKYYWSFSITWIPYATDHDFNVASCPTKVMDGLASGRPVISTDLPECCLYPEWIKTFRTAGEAIDLIRSILPEIGDAESINNSDAQVAFVRNSHTWDHRAAQLTDWLENDLADTGVPDAADQ